MNHIRQIVGFRVTRFVIVGLGNTAINFTILNLAFYGLHESKLVSSFIATSCAVVISFILNRNYVFLDKERTGRKLALFILVTGGGVLLIQNSVYALGIYLLRNNEAAVVNLVHALTGIHLSNAFVDVNLSNIIASLVVMVWNYNGYRLLVFNGERHGNEITETEAV